MKLLWLGYLVYSLGNCVMKLCIETGLMLIKLTVIFQIITEKSKLPVYSPDFL